MAASMEPTYKLHYWILGTPFSNVREIDMAHGLSFYDFKTRVEGDNNVRVKDVYTILPPISIESDDLERQIGLLSFHKLKSLHKGSFKILLQSALNEDHLHFIISTESFSVTCWLRASEESFSISLAHDAELSRLKTMIRDALGRIYSGRTIKLPQIKLYMYPTNEDDWEQKLHTWGGCTSLPPRGRVFELFNTTPFSSGYQIVVELNNPDIAFKCWVRGNDIGMTFTVDISSTLNVENLKGAIKNKLPEMSHINAHDLDLYQTALPLNRDLRAVSLSSAGTLLVDNSSKLSDIFRPNPPSKERKFDLIVDAMVSFRCWIRELPYGPSFSVNIRTMATVEGLQRLIQAADERLRSFRPHYLRLYRGSACEESTLAESLSAEPLRPEMLIRTVLSDVPLFQTPCIVVVPTDGPHRPIGVSSIDILRRKYLDGLDLSPAAPSERGKPAKFNQFQSSTLGILWARPPENDTGIPVTLLDEMFGRFVDECHGYEAKGPEGQKGDSEGQEEVVEGNGFARDLSLRMSGFFENEKDRQETFNAMLVESGIAIVPSSVNGYITDGDLHEDTRRYLILEVKSEIGSKGAEPHCQAILYYTEAVRKEIRNVQVPFNFPCLIVTLVGPQLTFSGATWTDRANYQLLSQTPLFYHQNDSRGHERIHRCLVAFRKLLNSLKFQYQSLRSNPGQFNDMQPTFPHLRSFPSSVGTTNFKYLHLLQNGKLLFVAVTEAGVKLCIKFVQRYDRKAHELCALWGIAPQLRGYRDDIAGGWIMVVMDYLVDYESLYTAKRHFSIDHGRELACDIKAMLTKLHQSSLVHGDVRDTNVMVRKEGEDRWKWMFVDFDWSGTIGEVRYPRNVHWGADLKRPEGVRGHKKIRAEHDLEMVDYLFETHRHAAVALS